MSTIEYAASTFLGLLAITATFLSLLEVRVSHSASLRIKARGLCQRLESAAAQDVPGRILRRRSSHLLRFVEEAGSARWLSFIIMIDALILVPVHVYGSLSPPAVTWEFRLLSPPGYYVAALVIIFMFLWWCVKFMRSAASNATRSPALLPPTLFVWLCTNVAFLNIFFLSAPKSDLANKSFEAGSSALLGLPYLFGHRWSLVIFLFFAAFSVGRLLFAVAWIVLPLVLPPYLSSGIAWSLGHTASIVGGLYAFVYAVEPGLSVAGNELYALYVALIGLSLVLSAGIFSLIAFARSRPVLGTIFLVLFPPVALFAWSGLSQVLGFSFSFYDPAAVFGLFLATAHLFLVYIVAFLFCAMAASLAVASWVLGRQTVAEVPFRGLAVHIAFLGAVLAFALFQVRALVAYLARAG